MGVSLNGGTPQIIHVNRVFLIYHPFWGTPIFGKHPYSAMVLFDRTQKNPKKASLSIPWPNSPGPQRATSVLLFPDQCYWGLLGGNSNSNMFKHVLHVSPPKNWGRWTQIDDQIFPDGLGKISNLTISYVFPESEWLGWKKSNHPQRKGYDDDEKVLERRKKAKEAKALEPVLQAIHGHPEVAAVQLQAAMALHQLLYTEEGGTKFWRMVMF